MIEKANIFAAGELERLVGRGADAAIRGENCTRTRGLTALRSSRSFLVSRLSEPSSTMHHSQSAKVWLSRLKAASASHSRLRVESRGKNAEERSRRSGRAGVFLKSRLEKLEGFARGKRGQFQDSFGRPGRVSAGSSSVTAPSSLLGFSFQLRAQRKAASPSPVRSFPGARSSVPAGP